MSSRTKDPSPLVSVIIPVFNAGEFIERGYLEVKNQDYSNLEIIFIDNNSTDNSAEKIRKLAGEDGRIRLLSETKQGAGAARNKGIRESTGKYISFFDIDDLMIPEKISRHVRILEANPDAGMVLGTQKKIYHTGRELIIKDPTLKEGLNDPPQAGINWVKNMSHLVNPSACTFTRQALISVGGFEDELLRGEDAALMIKTGLNFKVFYDKILISTYYRHPDSTVSKMNKIEENPYYFMIREFTTPYCYKFARDNNLPQLARLMDLNIERNLLDQAFRLKRSSKERIQFVKEELSTLNSRGFPRKNNKRIIFLSSLPHKIVVFLRKLELKLNLTGA